MNRRFSVAALITLMAYASFARCEVDSDDLRQSTNVVRAFTHELALAELNIQVSHQTAYLDAVIQGVTVLATPDAAPLTNMSVYIRDHRIAAIVPAQGDRPPEGLRVINGKDKYLLPGFVDMHVHRLQGTAADLLYLVNGITSMRDMNGSPWMLRQRQRVQRGQILGPNVYISGAIISDEPMGDYAVVVQDPASARQVVDEQAKAGYDFIKVHNNLEQPLFDAVVDEARARHLDVVGHVPHHISLQHAIQSGMRTIEHLKGYVLDESLHITDEDYVSLTRGAEFWNTPTLCTDRIYLRGEDALAIVHNTEAQYVPSIRRQQWEEIAQQPTTPVLRLQQNVLAEQRVVLKNLHGISRILVGTDCGGGFPFLVCGFAFHSEMELLESTGLSTVQVLRDATIEAAIALRRQNEFGSIEVGKRADLQLLEADPRASLRNSTALAGVMVAGRWLSKQDIKDLLVTIAANYQLTPELPARSEPRDRWLTNLVERTERVSQNGFVFMTRQLLQLQDAMSKLGNERLAKRVAALARSSASID
jgi:hypothetical protein